MKRFSKVTSFGFAAACGWLVCSAASASVIYSNIPSVLDPNYPSQPYQAQQTVEFGDHIAFAPGARNLNSVTITMSDWALASTYANNNLYNTNAAGFQHDLTFSIYNYTNDTSAGSLIASVTQSTLIPWRPEADPTCPGGTAWRATNGECKNGFAFNVTFDLSSQGVVLPDDIVYGLKFNTQSYGDMPIGADGPYNSLNFALTSAAPTVGTDVDSDTVFWNTGFAGFRTPGVGTNGVFGVDTNWTGYVPMVSFDASEVPEPDTLALFGLALASLMVARRRKL